MNMSVLCAILICATATATATSQAQGLATTAATATADDGAAFARAHQLVSVGDHRLNLFCSGTGSPTVVFEAPSGTPGWTWWAVQPAVAAKTRACVYDRAGLGFSDPATRPSTPSNELDDLHALLAAAAVKPPYVLVGNSVGGALAQLYAYRYPAEVSGLVLVEPMNENESARLDKITGGKMSALEAGQREGAKACAAAAGTRGLAPGSDAMRECVGGTEAAYRGALARIDLASRLTPAYWQAGLSEQEQLGAVQSQLRAARKPFGDLPIIVLVLVRGVSPFASPGQPQSAMNRAVEAENLAMQQEVARLSARGTWRIVAGAGHLVQADRPAAVVKAVDDLLAQLAR
jgi:pimeloyl-ACP methyl ester carboxylesterase